MSNRRADLLRSAVVSLQNGEDPFGGGFLREHNVSLDECYDLADALALGGQVVLAMMDPERADLEALAATEIVSRLNTSRSLDSLTRVLRETSGT